MKRFTKILMLGLIMSAVSSMTGCVSMDVAPKECWASAENADRFVSVDSDKIGAEADKSSVDLASVDPEIPNDELEAAKVKRVRIYRGTLKLAVQDFIGTQSRCEATAKQFGGYIQKADGRIIIVRIPVEKFNQAMTSFEKIGKVVERNIELEDVTNQRIDITARLKNLRAQEKRLREMLNKKGDIKLKDLLAVEQELTRVQTEIEVLQARLALMKNQISYSTIIIGLEKLIIRKPVLREDFEMSTPSSWVNELGLDQLMNY